MSAEEVRAEVLVFSVGATPYAVARSEVVGIRASRRARPAGSESEQPLPVVSLSRVLGLERDTAVDDRVMVIRHWGEPLGVEVTAIRGFRRFSLDRLRPLPPLVRRNCSSAHVVGLVLDDCEDEGDGTQGVWPIIVAIDLGGLLVEQGVEVAAGS